jgi:hypothetical protein
MQRKSHEKGCTLLSEGRSMWLPSHNSYGYYRQFYWPCMGERGYVVECWSLQEYFSRSTDGRAVHCVPKS